MKYKAQFLIPIQIDFEAADDENALADADAMTAVYLCKSGDPSGVDGLHSVIEVDDEGEYLRTIREV